MALLWCPGAWEEFEVHMAMCYPTCQARPGQAEPPSSSHCFIRLDTGLCHAITCMYVPSGSLSLALDVGMS
eukprot:CAMPEP_0194773384 /NCGR_PEP_ID=MMETSP0323_2-20130528/54690_1 /TAXON_ID=2866 ORGANISM="Crypthecodinium cohnii, Strain Seligo" /NCGR_SAMPLE_ID=MMETSP0323_2 /ASSEMBLY_ACC=CAM_ASM_000346 /LENGTH=70 /DNA_ID=CAMNT_0039708399 /DNA_START=95 /DNA_END=303 /DNA_ORIENTATION=+